MGWAAKRFTEVYFGISTGWAITVWIVVAALTALLLTLVRQRLRETPETQTNDQSEKLSSIQQTMTNSPGGMQAGRDIKLDIPPPIISHGLKVMNEMQDDGSFITVFRLMVASKVPVISLYVQVDVASVIEVTAWPARSGGSMVGPQGVEEGYGFVTIPNAMGEYEVFVKTARPGDCKLTYRLQD